MIDMAIVALAVSILMTGLFSGLMFSLVALLQFKWNRQSASEYITDIQPFLEVGKGNRFVAAVLFIGLLAPIPALLGGGTNTATGLIVVGLVVFALGALGVTVALNLPTYTALMRLDAGSPSGDWMHLRRRFYHLNLSRFIASTTAFILFITAMAIQV